MIWLLAILSSYRIHKRHTILQISVSQILKQLNVFRGKTCSLLSSGFANCCNYCSNCECISRKAPNVMLWLRFVVNLAMQGLARRGFWFAIVLCSSALVLGIWPSVKSEGMEVVCCFQLISHRILNSDLILGFQYATMQWIWWEPQLCWCLCCAGVKANDIMIWNRTFLHPNTRRIHYYEHSQVALISVSWFRVDPYWNLWHHMKSKNF